MSGPDFHGCYYPNGAPANNYSPCNSEASQSWCCYKNDICLNNGYCFQSSGAYSNRLGRGACTDNTWTSNACPQRCADVTPGLSTGLYLALDRTNGAFCCGRAYNVTSRQCQNATGGSTEPFNLDAGAVIYNRSTGSTIASGSLTLDQLGLNLNSSSSASPSSSTSSTATSQASTSSPAAAAASSNSNTTAIAAGIAVPLGVLLIAALLACGFLFAQNRKLRAEAKKSVPQPPETSQAAHDMHNGSVAPPHSPAPVYEYKMQQPHWAPYQSQQPPPPGLPVNGAYPPAQPLAQPHTAPVEMHSHGLEELPADGK